MVKRNILNSIYLTSNLPIMAGVDLYRLLKIIHRHCWTGKIITLKELVEFELLMELDALNHQMGKNWQAINPSCYRTTREFIC